MVVLTMVIHGFALMACSSDEAVSQQPDLRTDASSSAGFDAASDGACPFTGSYRLEKFVCGSTDITAAWKSLVPTDTLVVTAKPGGGCTMVITHESATCVEVETFEATEPSGSRYQFEALGVTSCSPASCKFKSGDEPCSIGDRANPKVPATIVTEGLKLRIRSPTAADSTCGGEDRDLLLAP